MLTRRPWPINTNACGNAMNTRIRSAVPKEHSAFCAPSAVLSPQAFLVSLMKTRL